MTAEQFLFELVIILFLILLNGFFSAAEIAVISSRKSKILQLVEEGVPWAKIVDQLKQEPDRLLAIVQIGVTLVGTMASVFGGAAAVQFLQPLLEKIPILQNWSQSLAFGIVVITLSYLSLVLGELVPKSIALTNPERVASWVVKPIDLLSRISSAPVKILTFSTNIILKMLGVEENPQASIVSEEEVKYMIKEGADRGVFDETEHELIHSVFEFADTSVREVMVPRVKIYAIEVNTPSQDVVKALVESGYSRIPVYEDTLDNIVGILYNKDVIEVLAEGKPIVLRELVHKAYLVPDTIMISDLLSELRRRRMHMAIVVNEYGEVAGLVTLEDLLEEIVGEIRDESETEDKGPIEVLKDGSLVVDGSVTIRDLQSEQNLPFPESPEYDTIAGFMLSKLQRLPKGGEIVTYEGYKLTVVDMDSKRIAKVKIEKLPKK
ncbi:MAG TPA: hemolysin family protein [Candidatus Limnocylindrales bacterium]|nr:hemolysin family protein [Candidatus Limnocylindrales bacterium]